MTGWMRVITKNSYGGSENSYDERLPSGLARGDDVHMTRMLSRRTSCFWITVSPANVG